MEVSSLPMYKHILFELLKIKRNFFIARKAHILLSLTNAEDFLHQTSGEMLSFALCFHLASSMVLTNAAPADIACVFGYIRENPEFDAPDPSTIVTMAMLYYLLHDLDLGEGTRFARLKARFADMNWLIGKKRMSVLGLS